MYNKKVLSTAVKNLDKAKAPKQPKDIITDPAGQWKFPGQPTRIPANNITMKGVNDPVLGVSDTGQEIMMYPGMDYIFPGANYVDEYPQMKKGGLVKLPNKSKKGSKSKAYSKSLEATNRLFAENSLFKKSKSRKNKIYDPNAKHYQDGGATSPEEWEQQIRSVESQIGNPADWTMDDYYLLQDKLNAYRNWRETTPEGQAVVDYHNEEGEYNIPLPEHLKNYTNAIMKSKLAYANEFGNPAAQRMIVPPDQPYDFGDGNYGTHYMASMDNYAVPQIQNVNGQLVLEDFEPSSNEAMRFDNPNDARYFAEHYKEVSPGFIEAELTPEEIEEYAKGGYIIEDISVPELTKAQKGKTVTPLYIENPLEYKFRKNMYDDSLRLYNAYKMQDKLMGPGSYKTKDKYKWNTAELKEGRRKRIDFQSEADQFKKGYNSSTARKQDKQLLDYYKKLGFKPNQIMYHSSPDVVSDKIKAIGSYFDGDSVSPIYKKPVQPVTNVKPETTPEIKTTAGPDPNRTVIGETEITKYDENGNIVTTIEYIYEDEQPKVKQPVTLEPQPEQSKDKYAYRTQWVRDSDGTLTARQVPYAVQRGGKGDYELIPNRQPGYTERQQVSFQKGGFKKYQVAGEVVTPAEPDEVAPVYTNPVYGDVMNWLNENPIYVAPDKPLSINEYEQINTQNMYPKISGKLLYIPRAGYFNEEQYKVVKEFPVEGGDPIRIYEVVGGEGKKKYIVDDKGFNKEFFSLYQEPKGRTREIYPVYGRGLSYRKYGGILSKMQDGGNFYTLKGSKAVYRKVGNNWEVDWNRSGNFQPVSKGDVKERTANLNKNAQPLYDRDYVGYINWDLKHSATAPKTNKPLTTQQKKAQQLFDTKFKVTKKSEYDLIEDEIKKEQAQYIKQAKELGVEADPKDLEQISQRVWGTRGGVWNKLPEDTIRAYTPEKPQGLVDKAFDIAGNPMTAAGFLMRGQAIPDYMQRDMNRDTFGYWSNGVFHTERNPLDIPISDMTNLGLVSSARNIYNTATDDISGNFWTLDNALELLNFIPAFKTYKGIKRLLKDAKGANYLTTKTPKQLPGSSNAKFVSEIDWSKWNPDTPKYPELISEYNAIEEATKADGTWMKNSDGSAFQGTPEQFIQEQSSWFKKAYPEGVNKVYRGVNQLNAFSDFSKGTPMDESLRGNRGIFTADENLAKGYVFNDEKTLLNPFVEDQKPGYYELIYPKGKQITYNTNLSDWQEVNLSKMSSKINIEAQINSLKNLLERQKAAGAGPELIKNQIDRINTLQRYYDEFDYLQNDPESFMKMRNVLGDVTTTDNIADYIAKTDLNAITLQNILDGGLGDVTIVNNRPGNYLKSRIGNLGFFDMTNPDIYKSLIPYIGTGYLGYKGLQGAGVLPEESQQFDKGGIVSELSKKEIDDLVAQGYIIEDAD